LVLIELGLRTVTQQGIERVGEMIVDLKSFEGSITKNLS
jgi:hypothetical protein